MQTYILEASSSVLTILVLAMLSQYASTYAYKSGTPGELALVVNRRSPFRSASSFLADVAHPPLLSCTRLPAESPPSFLETLVGRGGWPWSSNITPPPRAPPSLASSCTCVVSDNIILLRASNDPEWSRPPERSPSPPRETNPRRMRWQFKATARTRSSHSSAFRRFGDPCEPVWGANFISGMSQGEKFCRRKVRLKKKRVGRVWTIHWTTAVAMVRMYVLLFAWALLSVAYFVLVESATVLTSSDARPRRKPQPHSTLSYHDHNIVLH